ncbi:MAG TPA: periplasmic heavy metal sensor [Clostridia bacterium]|nr:periplasmic heavy metal sensor [Clostridia bacterium]
MKKAILWTFVMMGLTVSANAQATPQPDAPAAPGPATVGPHARMEMNAPEAQKGDGGDLQSQGQKPRKMKMTKMKRSFAPPTPPPLPRIPRAWWKDSEMAKELNLTDQQKNQLEQAFIQNRLNLIDLRAAVEKEETKLQPLIGADKIDEGQINAQLDALVAARGRLEKASALMSVNMRRVLTQEQWKKLQTMQSDRTPRPPRAPKAPKRMRYEMPGMTELPPEPPTKPI